MTKTSIFFLVFCYLQFVVCYVNNIKFNFKSNRAIKSLSIKSVSDTDPKEKYTSVPNLNPFSSNRPSINDKARTITHVCTSGTLCTVSAEKDVEGTPFGSYVDYILDNKGWPVLLLSEQSLHTVNIMKSPVLSLFCQLPRSQNAQSSASLSRVTILGKIQPVPTDELSAAKLSFTLTHPYSLQIAESPKFSFFKIKPEKIYFSGGFGVMATWVDVEQYEAARPDVLAKEVPMMLARINIDKQGELYLLCKHFIHLNDIDVVRIQAIDQLGIDLRVKTGDYTDEYRIGFRHSVKTAEDAKSELMKLFQEAWERENGMVFVEGLPPIIKYAEDILRNKK